MYNVISLLNEKKLKLIKETILMDLKRNECEM